MSTRHLMALDYADYHANGVLRKHSKNRPLGNIEQKHNYIPSQPVLSCRTVDIDLPGTRTYRPKSTVDIIEEQQKLIRQLYTKQRSTASAPPHQRTDPSIRSPQENGMRSVNIEVKGRPLTSLSHIPSHKADKIGHVPQRRPRTTAGRLKNVKPATDTFMVVKVDKDFVETSKNNRQLTNQIHSYWKSENHNLAVGKFVRGQKRPDDVPPTLDAWFTFGGAAGDESQGVIDAFTSFKNSNEYYNIEGSVGSKVAQQLQKGDKIRIGINGVLQTQDLKVKKWKKEDTSDSLLSAEESEEKQEEVEEEEDHVVISEDPIELKETVVEEEPEDPDNDFRELRIDDALEELLKEEEPVVEVEQPKEMTTKKSPRIANQSVIEGRESPPAVTIPLSWDDQCSKENVKVINPRPLTSKGKFNSMSETRPVKFERLISNGRRPKLCDPSGENGFKVKQRLSTMKDKKDGRSSASKIKVVYIDPLNEDEDNKVDSMSVEEIINSQLKNRELAGSASHHNTRDTTGMMAINDDSGGNMQRPAKLNGLRNGQRNNNSRPSSNSSDRGITISSPKLKTIPVNSSHLSGDPTNLSITTPGARHSGPVNEMPRVGKSAGRISPNKSFHRSGASTGGSIKVGPMPGEPEYIKITSQLKVAANSSPVTSNYSQQMSYHSYVYRPGSNTPQEDIQSPNDFEADDMCSNHAEVDFVRENLSHFDDVQIKDNEKIPAAGKEPVMGNDSNNNSANINVNDNGEDGNDQIAPSVLSESPTPTTVAISIPTADELSDRESPTNSPSRHHHSDDDLTNYERRERDLRNEQIGQLTDLLGNVIVNENNPDDKH